MTNVAMGSATNMPTEKYAIVKSHGKIQNRPATLPARVKSRCTANETYVGKRKTRTMTVSTKIAKSTLRKLTDNAPKNASGVHKIGKEIDSTASTASRPMEEM